MPNKLILRNYLSPGDIVMLTAAVRDLHQCYPGRFLTDVRTTSPALWENNPYLTPLRESDPEVQIVDCDYPLIHQSNQTPYHCVQSFSEFLNDRLQLQIRATAFHGDIHLSGLEKSWYSQVHELTGQDTPYWVIVAGGKFDATIKWWQSERYQAVVDHFRGKIQFVQVGERGHHHPKLSGVIDLRGRTDLRQFVRLIYNAQGVLCGVTAAMHLAAAVESKVGRAPNRPCVVVAGGREPVNWEAYPHHQFIHTIGQLSCCAHGGCWRDRIVRLDDGDFRDNTDRLCVNVVENLPRCMHMITPAEVVRRIESYFAGGVVAYLTPEQAEAAEKGIAATASNPFEDSPAASAPVALSKSSRVALVQQASGPYVEMLSLTHDWHAQYAARHALTFLSVRGPVQFERSPVWDKIQLIRMQLAAGYDLVVWLDADTLVVNPAADVRGALSNGAPIAMCRHPLPWGEQPWHWNAGVVFVRNTNASRWFFDEVWRREGCTHSWQEQARINELSLEHPGLIQELGHQWNCTRGLTSAPNPVVRAWHGKGMAALTSMRATARRCLKESYRA
jgi:ADP-heptose:LPS heptosyltransferase